MSLLDWLIYLAIAAICGGIGAAIIGARHMGCLTLIAVGLIGAMLGSWLSHQFHMGEAFDVHVGNHSLPLLWTIIGSMLLTGIAGLLGRRYWRL